jgi:hypothetical protein
MSTTLENRVRRKASRLGYVVRKSRTQNIHANDYGEYALFDAQTIFPAFGWDYDATLGDIEAWLDEANAGVTPTYVREFLRWRRAKDPVRRMQIVFEQAAACIDIGPDLETCRDPLTVVVANGKRLGDCTKQEMMDIGEWCCAVGEAAGRNAEICRELAGGDTP